MVGVYHAAQPKFVNLTAPTSVFTAAFEPVKKQIEAAQKTAQI